MASSGMFRSAKIPASVSTSAPATTPPPATNAYKTINLAAGKGKRMHSALPKVLHRVAGLPMIEYVLARAAATADEISGGRVTLGMGAGWMEREHEAYGFPFDTARERIARLAEQVEIAHGLLHEERFDFEGTYYRLQDAPGLGRPNLPILVGGTGLCILYIRVNALTMWLTLATFVGYAVVYTVWLKRRTTLLI